MHIGGRGAVSSSWASTSPGMVLQCLGWWNSGGDGRTRSKVTEEMRPAGLMLSVQKVVPTLTSTSAEIYLLMVGAKQPSDTRFILVLARAVRPAGVCSRHCISSHCGACRGELQAWWERRWCPQVPEV
jgi:hypothetical protein